MSMLLEAAAAAIPCAPAGSPFCALPLLWSAEADFVVDKATDGAGQTIRHWIGEGAGVVMQATVTGWTGIVTPPVGSADGTPSGDVAFLQESVLWLSLSILVISFICAMGMMVFSNSGKPGIEALKGLGRYLLVTAAAVPAIAIFISVMDVATAWIIENATGDDFAAGLGSMLVDTGGLGLVLYLIVVVIGMLCSGGLVVLLIWRGGVLVVLTGSIGVAAALGTNEQGKSILHHYIGWIVAYGSWKLGAGVFYASAFRMMSGGTAPSVDDQSAILLRQITALALMFLALLALPAMIRLVTPMAAAVAGGRGFGAAAMSALAIALPTGAIAAGAAASGGAGGGGTGGQGNGPTGAVTPPPAPSTPPPAPAPPSGAPSTASQGQPVPVP